MAAFSSLQSQLNQASSLWDLYRSLATATETVLGQTLLTGSEVRSDRRHLLEVAYVSGHCLRGFIDEAQRGDFPLTELFVDALAAAQTPRNDEELARLVVESGQMAASLTTGDALGALFVGVNLLVRGWRADVFDAGRPLHQRGSLVDMASACDSYATFHQVRYASTGVLADLDRAVRLGEVAVAVQEHPSRAFFLDNQARRLDEVARRGDAVAHGRARLLGVQAIAGTPPTVGEHFFRLERMAERIRGYQAQKGNLDEAVIAWYAKAVASGRELASQGVVAALPLANATDELATLHFERYRRSGDKADLDYAVALGSIVVADAAEEWGMYPLLLDNQAIRLHVRYQLIGDSADLASAISLHERLEPFLRKDLPGLAAIMDHRASTLFSRARLTGDPDDLLQAVSLGEQAVDGPGNDPDAPGYLANQAQRLHLLWKMTGDSSAHKRAVELARAAVRNSPDSSPHRSRRLARLAQLLFVCALETSDVAEMAEAEATVDEAIRSTPRCHPDRGARLLLKLMIVLSDEEPTARKRLGLDELCLEVTQLLISGGASVSTLSLIGSLADVLVSLGRQNQLRWETIANLGSSVLESTRRLADLPVTDLRDDTGRDERLVVAHSHVEGLLGATVVALHHSGRPVDAIRVVEEALAVIARDIASRVPWNQARQSFPQLVERVAVAGRELELCSPDAEVRTLEDRYFNVLDELRQALGLPVDETDRADLTETRDLDCVWLIQGPDSAIALRQVSGNVDSHELIGVGREVTGRWVADLSGSELRNPAVEQVRSDWLPAQEKAIRSVLYAMDENFNGALAAVDNDKQAWLIPVGLLGSLPWQALHPRRRLHISAMHILPRALTKGSRGAMAVFADPEEDLPGARREALELRRRLGAKTFVGSKATLDKMNKLRGLGVLHIACHGHDEPALQLADVKLSLVTHHGLRHLWQELDLLFLNSCTSAASVQAVRDQGLSLATVALVAGARQVVVALWPVDDTWAGVFALGWYLAADRDEALERAQSVTPHATTRYAYQVLG